MNIAYFPNQCALNSKPVMSAVIDSLVQDGHQCVANSMDADVAVIWSVLWSGRMQGNFEVYNHYQKNQKPVIIIDIGALYRGNTWKISVNNITAQGYYGHTQNLDWNRPRKLGISEAINLTRNPRIVIACQHAKSLQVANVDLTQWMIEQIQQVRQRSDRPIVIRPHPRSKLTNTEWINQYTGVTIEKPMRIIDTYDSYNLSFDCYALINYNSGPGIQAALAGTRPIVHSSSLAHPVGIGWDQLETPYTIDRDRWLVEICHTEYTLDEIKNGSWIKRITLAL
jgi:hypothetical protein